MARNHLVKCGGHILTYIWAKLHECVLNPKNMANLEAFYLVISSSIHLQFLKSYRLILSMSFMIEGCFNFLKSAGLHSGIIFICKIRGQIMCKHKTIANYASDWLTRQANQSKAWFPKYLPSYISKSLAHDPALNQKWEEKKNLFFDE